MGAIRPGETYYREVVITGRGGKRNRRNFYVWTEHQHAPFCDDMVLEYERTFMQQEVAVMQVVAFKLEQRQVLKIGLNGEPIVETETVSMPVIVNRSELEEASGWNPDDEIAF